MREYLNVLEVRVISTSVALMKYTVLDGCVS